MQTEWEQEILNEGFACVTAFVPLEFAAVNPSARARLEFKILKSTLHAVLETFLHIHSGKQAKWTPFVSLLRNSLADNIPRLSAHDIRFIKLLHSQTF